MQILDACGFGVTLTMIINTFALLSSKRTGAQPFPVVCEPGNKGIM